MVQSHLDNTEGFSGEMVSGIANECQHIDRHLVAAREKGYYI